MVKSFLKGELTFIREYPQWLQKGNRMATLLIGLTSSPVSASDY